ncbi:MAG: SPFH domain-containing protein [Phycisphaerales bacterium]|nr:SPFH domain-containing protein [Phycisphaerales bacterium]
MRRPIIFFFSAVVLAILFVVLCTFVRRPYERILLYRFGNLITQEHQTRILPGYNWYLKLPTDGVIRVDTRLHLFYTPLQQINTKGSQSISVRTYAAWRIVDPLTFYKTTGTDENLQKRLGNALSSTIGQTISRHNMDDMFNTDPAMLKTHEMEQQIQQAATEGNKEPGKKLDGMRELGVEIVQVGFSRMAFAPNNADAIYRRMAEEQSAKAADYLAKGRAENAKLVSDGKRQAAEITADAHREAERIRGEADAQATAALAAVQKSQAARDFYQYWKSLDFIKASFTKNTYLVLPTDSDILRALFTAPQKSEASPPPSQKPEEKSKIEN